MLSFRNVIGAGALAATVMGASAYLMDATPAEACIHPQKEFKYPIKSGAQKGLIFFADGRQEMVIRPGYKVDGEGLEARNDAVEGFTEVAWLVPVPSLPDNYEEVDDKMFGDLEKFTKAELGWPARNARVARDGEPGQDADQPGAQFEESVEVGDYTIQPVKAKGELGALELNGWLEDNGFGTVDAEIMKYYQDNDHYWLAVKLRNPEGLPADGTVKPLQIGFKTDKPVYPIKINEGRGEFDLELWLITNNKVDLDKTRAFGLTTVEQRDVDMEQTNRKTAFNNLPESVRDIAAGVDELKPLKDGDLHCYRFFGAGLNEKTDLGKLKDDLKFEWKPEPVKAED